MGLKAVSGHTAMSIRLLRSGILLVCWATLRSYPPFVFLGDLIAEPDIGIAVVQFF